MEFNLSRSTAVLLLLCLASAGNQSQDCEDTQIWCSFGADFCDDSTVSDACPLTCGLCQLLACDVCEHNCTMFEDNTIQCSCVKGFALGTDNASCVECPPCEHSCIVLGANSTQCFCYEGYRLWTDNTSCVDINECLDFPCEDTELPFCRNYDGGYECTAGKCAEYPGFIDSYSWDGCCQQTKGVCGKNVQNNYATERIIGGEPAIVKFWPWMVYISFELNLCGGSLINNEWIVSAAHCFIHITDIATQQVDLRLGVYDTFDLSASYVEKRNATQIIMHENYSFPYYDIAVLKMNSPVEYNDYIGPVCLPHGYVPTVGMKCYAAGYGRTVPDSNEAARFLHQVDLAIVDRQECKNAFSEVQAIDTEKMICAGYKEGGKDACQGDSGGPLMCQHCDTCDWYLAGVTSFGRGCGQPNFYGVYSDVEYFEKWIESKTDGIEIQKGTCTPVAPFDPWSEWSPCTQSCGGGQTIRTRNCSVPSGQCVADEFGLKTREIAECGIRVCC